MMLVFFDQTFMAIVDPSLVSQQFSWPNCFVFGPVDGDFEKNMSIQVTLMLLTKTNQTPQGWIKHLSRNIAEKISLTIFSALVLLDVNEKFYECRRFSRTKCKTQIEVIKTLNQSEKKLKNNTDMRFWIFWKALNLKTKLWKSGSASNWKIKNRK